MLKNEFLEKFTDILQTETEIKYDTELNNLEEWDSLAKISLIAFVDDELSQKITFNDIKEIQTVKDLAEKLGITEQ